AMRKNKQRLDLLAIGNEAYEMYEKSPDGIDVQFPVKDGVIANLKYMEQLFERFFIKCNEPKVIKSGRFLLALPTDITEVEKRAFYDVVSESSIRAKEIKAVQKPVADAVGAGIDIESQKGNMIVNIGADTTEITVTSSGGIVISRILKNGGNKLDESICAIVKKKYNILIGQKTAEQIKIHLADALYDEDNDDEEFYSVYGRNIITGLPSERTISSDFIYEAIEEFAMTIIDSIKTLLERTPPELVADIHESGIYITGGSSCIKNIDKLISKETGIKVNTVRTPAESVVRGLAKIISDSKYKKLIFTPEDAGYMSR
ncbi:MAG: rod shape-determining protein, partial [Lachnospiraceae bacterium]|nr:rod shape-determining protein [Lachnospiraceae bacterium]